MTVRNLLRKGIDKYEGRRERSDEEFANAINRNVEALSDRRTLTIHLAIVGTINLLIWLSVFLFPRDVDEAWETVSGVNNKITAVLIAIVFGLGFWLTYGLFRLKFHDLENKQFDNDILSSFHASEHSLKRYRVYLFSAIGGVMNVLLLIATEIYLIADR